EIALTSNDFILGVSGADHPFMQYLNAGVPLVIATDDEGVARSDVTHEYQRAVETYTLTYAQLKQLSRNSLEYSFLSGAGIWSSCSDAEKNPEATACKQTVGSSEKAREQWRLEKEFVE